MILGRARSCQSCRFRIRFQTSLLNQLTCVENRFETLGAVRSKTSKGLALALWSSWFDNAVQWCPMCLSWSDVREYVLICSQVSQFWVCYDVNLVPSGQILTSCAANSSLLRINPDMGGYVLSHNWQTLLWNGYFGISGINTGHYRPPMWSNI